MLVFVVRRLLSVAAVMVGVAALVFSVFYGLRPERIADGTGYFHQLAHFLDRVFLHLDLGTSQERTLSFQAGLPVAEGVLPGRPVARGRRLVMRHGGPASRWARWPTSGAGRSSRAGSTASRPSA